MSRALAVRGAARRALAATVTALTLALVPVVASAAPAPSPTSTPSPTSGSTPAVTPTDPLTSVLDATGKVAAQVAAAQTAYDAATAHLTQVQDSLAAAVTAYGVAEDDLAARTADADQTATAAAAAAAESDLAQRALRQQAALLYQGTPTDSFLAAIFGPGGPQGLSDLQVGMTAVLTRQDDLRVRAESLAADAELMRLRAAAARDAQVQVADTAKAARTALQTVVAQAQADTARIATEQTALLARLSALRSESAALEQQREDHLAAAAGLPVGSTPAVSLATLYASGGAADLTKAQLDPQTVAQGMLLADGLPATEWPCLEKLWTGESGWNWAATNRASGAYGIPQSLPASKMASAGTDWLVNPVTQIRWGLTYIEQRYGTPCQTWSIWQSRSPHWY